MYALGRPAGVLQLLDRHNRDCAAVAERLGIEHLEAPDAVAGSPFEAIPVVRVPGWKETALWWPAESALVVAEVVGTNSIFNAGRGGVGMHPMLRALPPGSLRRFEPQHLLTGHGAPVHGAGAAAGLEEAYARSRRDIPRAVINLPAPTASRRAEGPDRGRPLPREHPRPLQAAAPLRPARQFRPRLRGHEPALR